jgi:PadR family transcriptional regulator PadR
MSHCNSSTANYSVNGGGPMSYVQQLLKGLIDPIILYTINRMPMYGYQIIRELEKRTGGGLKLNSGTVYPALIRLEKHGLVTSFWDKAVQQRKRRYYQITEQGQQFLRKRLTQWHDFCALADRIIPKPNAQNDAVK